MRTHQVDGEFVSSDVQAHALRFKDAEGKVQTARFEHAIAQELGNLQPGDRVQLTCRDNDRGEHEAITAVQRIRAA